MILHVSDLHGQLRGTEKGGGYARVAAYVRRVQESAGPKTDVLVLFGGDLTGKSALPCRKSQEKACVPLLAKLGGADKVVAVLGNHELYKSPAELDALLDASGATWVASNVSGLKSRNFVNTLAWTGPKSGAALQVFGWASGEPTKGLRVRDLPTAADLQDWTNKVKASNQSALVLTHRAFAKDEVLAKEICAKSELKVIAVLKGDDHEVRKTQSDCLKVFEPGAFGENIVHLELLGTNGQWSLVREDVVSLGIEAAQDEGLKAEVESIYAQHAPEAAEVVAQVAAPKDPDQVADLLADAYRTVTHADVAIVNRGAVKAGLEAGGLQKEKLLVTIPFNNEIMGLDWAVKDLEAALCRASSRPMDPSQDDGAQLHLAGAKLLDAGQPNCRLETSKRGSVKVAVDNYIVGKSARWLGKDLQGRTFRFQVSTEQALNRYFKMKGGRL